MDARVVRWYPVLFLALLAALTAWIDQTVQPPPPVRDGSTRHDPDFIVDEFSATRMNPDGSLRHSVTGRRMVHFPDDNSTHVEEPRFVHYDYATAPVRITANRALVSRNGENVYFIGDVLIKREAYADNDAMQLETEMLQVIPDRDLAKTDKPVTMTSGTSRVDSVGMEFDNRTRIVKLLSKVKVTYASPAGIPGLSR
jgi:lipopolysaccharide export system protein LptC